MLPKTRKYLRGFEHDFYKFIEDHKSEFLRAEYDLLTSALTDIIRADGYLFHLGLSHTQAKDLEDVSTGV